MFEEKHGAVLGPPPVRETISAAVYRQLREAILTALIPMGTRINEVELASDWRISRTPIRDALRRLEAEGLVQGAPGRGMIVPVLTRVDVDELYALREGLEGMAARLAAERATPQFLVHLNTLLKMYGAALKKDDTAQLVLIDGALHDAVAQMAQNRRLEQTVHVARLRVHQIHARSFRLKGRAGRTFREMATLVAAIRTRNASRAETSMRAHLTSLRGDVAAAFDELLASKSS
ncbi:MAG TPA: GntR family transcriptional regulator [bacterium]|nr:GntR family transcriptional regulator [bacterium]